MKVKNNNVHCGWEAVGRVNILTPCLPCAFEDESQHPWFQRANAAAGLALAFLKSDTEGGIRAGQDFRVRGHSGASSFSSSTSREAPQCALMTWKMALSPVGAPSTTTIVPGNLATAAIRGLQPSPFGDEIVGQAAHRLTAVPTRCTGPSW